MVAADLVSFSKTALGFIGCLVIVDHYSKWVAAVPIKNKKASTVVNAFQFQIFPFLLQMPSTLLTDNGPEFTSSEFTSFLETYNIKQQFTTPYCPSSNGAVERVNRTVQGLLKSLVSEKQSWDKELPKALHVYNNTVHSELSMSPAAFLLSRSHDMKHFLKNELQRTWKVGHPKFASFKVGQQVLMRVKDVGRLNTNKFSEKYKGPLTVQQVNDNGVTYKLSNSNGGIIRAHHCDLFLYKSPPPYVLEHSLCNKGVSFLWVGENTDSGEKGPTLSGSHSYDVGGVGSDSFSSPSSADESESGHGFRGDCDNLLRSDSMANFPADGGGDGCRASSQREESSDHSESSEDHCCRGCIWEATKELRRRRTLREETGVIANMLSPIIEVEEASQETSLHEGSGYMADYDEIWSFSPISQSIATDIGGTGGEVEQSGYESLEGSGRLQVSSQEGEEALDEEHSDEHIGDLENFIDSYVSGRSFGGFEQEEGLVEKVRKVKMLAGRPDLIMRRNSTPPMREYLHHTRSRGPVADVPHVQQRILERRSSVK